MSSKRDWNDVSDSDSESEGEEQIQQAKEELQQKNTHQIPSLKKNVSSPLPDKRTLNEQQNLLKLQKFAKEQVWLYIPIYYKDNIEDIDRILSNQKQIFKIEKFPKGWNVQTSRESAKHYILEGKKDASFSIKFFFSNKNQQNGNNYHKRNDNYRNGNDNRKVKYLPKQTNNKSMKSPDSLRRIQSQQEYPTTNTPKSPTYKNQQWRKYEEDSRGYRQKNFNNPNHRQANKKHQRDDSDSLSKERNNFNKAYKPKYTTKNEVSYKQDSQYTPDSPKKKYVQKQQEQLKAQTQITPTKIESKTQNNIQKQQPQQKQEKQLPATQQTSKVSEVQSSPNEKKAIKKHKNKNNLLRDSNNPFSMLNGI